MTHYETNEGSVSYNQDTRCVELSKRGSVFAYLDCDTVVQLHEAFEDTKAALLGFIQFSSDYPKGTGSSTIQWLEDENEVKVSTADETEELDDQFVDLINYVATGVLHYQPEPAPLSPDIENILMSLPMSAVKQCSSNAELLELARRLACG